MNTDRKILHVDCNCFYAGCEMAEHPELRGLPVIVGGEEEARHGIVLTASYPAKRCGVKTAMTLWEARRACPEAIIVSPHYGTYMKYSQLAREIYYQYTDRVESFGLDEAWLDITGSLHLFGGEMLVAREISERVKAELGLTVSVGVSWNKIFAKFGSDHDKPDGLMRITPDNAHEIVWPSPVDDLLYVGPATRRKLNRFGIMTIGELAEAPERLVRGRLGKMGEVVQTFARGLDVSPVRPLTPAEWVSERVVKSVGNGATLPFDIDDERTARQVIWIMGESVAQRLRRHGLCARTVSVTGRDFKTLLSRTRQAGLAKPSNITSEICSAAAILLSEWDFAHEKLRAIGVRGSNLVPVNGPAQLDLEGVEMRREEQRHLDAAIDTLRSRFGNGAVRRLGEMSNTKLSSMDPMRDNIIHPVSYFA